MPTVEEGAVAVLELPFSPLLESWERSTSKAQLRLGEYRDGLSVLAQPVLAAPAPPFAFGFYAAGRQDIAAGGCDLDNFLTPVVKALGGGEAFALVWATRGRADEPSRLTLAHAGDVRVATDDAAEMTVRLSGSPTRPEWKAKIAEAVGIHPSSGITDPVSLAVRYRLSPLRNWVTLWKPTIDALGGILGEGRAPVASKRRPNLVSHPRTRTGARPGLGYRSDLKVDCGPDAESWLVACAIPR